MKILGKRKRLYTLRDHLNNAMQYHNYSGFNEQQSQELHKFLNEDIKRLETRLKNLESSADYKTRPM